jgi:hypothetical protein
MRLNYEVRPIKINNVFYASHVADLIFGKKKRINIIASNTGLNYGLMKVILYGSYVFFLDIVDQNYIASRIIGLSIHRKRILIFQNASTLFTMALISIRKDVLLA